MAQWLKQSTSITVKVGPFLDSTDGNTVEGALTLTQPDIRLSKNGGAFAQKAAVQTLVHDENGYYGLTLDATDTNTLGRLTVHVHETGALAVWHEFMVVPANVWDSFFGADALQVHANEITADLITAAAIANGAIDAATFAAGAIDAAAIAADAIGASELAADAVAEIADAVWDELSTGHVSAGKAGEQLWTDMDAILVDTGTTLDGRLPAALVGGRMNSDVGAKTGNVALSTQEKADVNVEVLDVLNTDTFAEPGQATPGATVSLVTKLGYLYKAWRNKFTTDATDYKLFNDDAATVDQKATLSDSGTTYTKGEVATGP